jgi:hypothetical protein
MKKQLTGAFLVALLTGMASAQSTTNGTVVCQSGTQQTVCLGNSTTTGGTTNNTNTAEQQREAYEAGQNMGRGIANMRANHWIKKFCKKHPGQSWWYKNPAAGIDASGVCP